MTPCGTKFNLLFVIALSLSACHRKDEKHQEGQIDMSLMSNQEPNFHLSREQLLHKLNRDRFDILIIGGGATGAGAALDAASRGLKVALIEANDFSSGTSSRSTKLVHGGVRYLENAIKHLDRHEYALVRDALAERKRFLNNAPHLTKLLPIITPVYSVWEAFYYLVGLKLYDLVAGESSLGRSRFLSREKSLELFPMLKKEGLTGSVLYYDGQFNDARMNITLILTAVKEGATALNYVRALELIKEDGLVVGAVVQNTITGESFPVYAKVVINASGSFADNIRKMDNQNAPNIIATSQGSHILLPERFSSKTSGLIIPKTTDGRVLFLLPWQGKILAGTTDQPASLLENPKATLEEVEYILAHIRKYLTLPVSRSDIIATFSGLRPLVKPEHAGNTASISRDHTIEISASHLVSIVGGKWTTYRKMAEDVINTAVTLAKLSPEHKSQTKELKLVGAQFYKETLAEELIAYELLSADVAHHLAETYGDRADAVMEFYRKGLKGKIAPGYPYVLAEIAYAAHHEYAVHATDILARRTRLAFLDNQAARMALPIIVSVMAEELKWNKTRIQEELKLSEEFLDTMI